MDKAEAELRDSYGKQATAQLLVLLHEQPTPLAQKVIGEILDKRGVSEGDRASAAALIEAVAKANAAVNESLTRSGW